jgi:hypothetical protein
MNELNNWGFTTTQRTTHSTQHNTQQTKHTTHDTTQYNLLDHRRICGPSLTETSLCGAWLYSANGTVSHHKRPRAVSSIAVISSSLTPCCSTARRHNHISGVLNAGRTSAPAVAALSALINQVSSPVRIISSRLLAFHQHVLRSLLCHLFHLWPSTAMPCSLVAQLSTTMTFTTVYGISSIYIWSQAA